MSRLSREIIFRDAVNPLRCAVRAARKPGVDVLGHPFDACVSPLDAAGNASLGFTPRHMISRAHLVVGHDRYGHFLNIARTPVPA
jgi:hypothetical protein